MDDLKAIRVFLTVADQLSFSAAAKHLGLTPASVTRIIAQLERDLGQQVLVRTTRQVSLTSAGALVAARFRPIVDAFTEAAEDIARAGRPDVGRLRINAPLSMGMRLMPDVISRFSTAFPNVAVELRMTDTLVDVMSDECDLAIRVSRAPTDKSSIWRKLCEVPLHAIAAPAYLDQVGEIDDPNDIPTRDAMSYSADGSAETWVFRKGALRRSIRAGTQILSNNGEVLFGLARKGAGICVLPDFLIRQGLEAGDVRLVLPDWHIPPLWLTLFYPPYTALPPLVAQFADFFEAYLQDLDGLKFP